MWYYPPTALVICAVPTSVKTTPELFGPAFGVLPKTGDEELEDRGKPGWERLRMICARSTLAWRRQDGALWIDRHGVYSWMRLRPRDTLQRERKREMHFSTKRGIASVCNIGRSGSHIGWNLEISETNWRTISRTPSLFVAHRPSTYSQGNIGKFGGTRGGVWKNGVLQHKSGIISETRKDRWKVTMEGLSGLLPICENQIQVGLLFKDHTKPSYGPWKSFKDI